MVSPPLLLLLDGMLLSIGAMVSPPLLLLLDGMLFSIG